MPAHRTCMVARVLRTQHLNRLQQLVSFFVVFVQVRNIRRVDSSDRHYIIGYCGTLALLHH